MGAFKRSLLAAAFLFAAAAVLEAEVPAADWAAPELMRGYLRGAAPDRRLEAYREWLAMERLARPAVSEALGAALAADLPMLEGEAARALLEPLAKAMARSRGFWPESVGARGPILAALLDRASLRGDGEGLVSAAIALLPLAPEGFALTGPRASLVLAAIGAKGRALSDDEERALMSLCRSAFVKGPDLPSALALAERVMVASSCSIWTWMRRMPELPPDKAAVILAEPLAPAPRLFCALAYEVEIDEGGSLSARPRYPKTVSMQRLFDRAEGLGIGDAPSSEDWKAALALLRADRSARTGEGPASEADLISLLDPSRPSQAAAAASILSTRLQTEPSGGPSPAVAAAFAGLIEDPRARDPVLRLVCARALAKAVSLGAAVDVTAIDSMGAALLDRDAEASLKLACARALSSIDNERSSRTLEAFLASPASGEAEESLARAYAAMSLGEREDGNAIDVLLENIDTRRDSTLDYHCVVALGRIADRAGLKRLLELAPAGPSAWEASRHGAGAGSSRPAGVAPGRPNPGHDTLGALCWALLPLESSLARGFYLDRWEAAGHEAEGSSYDEAAWFSALYLIGSTGQGETEALRKSWQAYAEAGLAQVAAAEPSLVGAALDVVPLPSLLDTAAASLDTLEGYPKACLAAALIPHPDVGMIGAFRKLLDSEDDYLVYAALAAMDRLLSDQASPLNPELRARLADFRDALPRLGPAQLARGTEAWRDLLLKRLDGLLARDR